MNRADIATKIITTAERIADRIAPPTYGVKIVWDENYEIDGATAWGDPEDAQYAAETRAKVESGEWIIVGMVTIEHDRDGIVRETRKPADLWGIVTDAADLGDLELVNGRASTFELGDLRGYLRTVADDLIAEARNPSATPTCFRSQS
jgi:hypothetical protein